MEGLAAGLGAFGFWTFIAAVVVGGMWYDIRRREAQQETIRRMIDSGQPIDEGLADKLLSTGGGNAKSMERDLMIGALIVLFIAPGLAAFGLILGWQHPGALAPLLGAAVLVGFVGLGLFAAAKIVAARTDTNTNLAVGRPKE